jgi:hypothetical protein
MLNLFRLALIGICIATTGLAHAQTIVAAWGRCLSYTTYGPDNLSDSKTITSGYGTNFIIGSNGVVVGWSQTSQFGQSFYVTGMTNAVAVAASESGNLALHTDGTLSAWRTSAQVPAGVSNVTAIAAGRLHFLALRNDGTVIGWGNDIFGQIDVPSDLVNVTAVAAGDYHSLALKGDGTVVAWGDNSSGQTNVPAGLGNIVAIAGGGAHSLALDSNGRVIAWGSNTAGQTNVASDITNVVAIAAGSAHSVALKAEGTVVAWGDNSSGQTNVPIGLSHAVAISARDLSSLALLRGEIPPLISYQPVGGTVPPGGSIYSVCLAQGSLPLTYQWRHDGTNIARTSTVLSFNPAQQSQSGAYSVVVSNAFGSQESSNAIWVVSSSTNLQLVLRLVAGPVPLPSLNPQFEVIALDSSGTTFLPAQGTSLQLESSPDLQSWTFNPGGLILTNGLLLIQDPNAGAVSHRFYRVKQQ